VGFFSDKKTGNSSKGSDKSTSSSSGEHKGGDVKAVAEKNGNTSNYYGGKGTADGPGHSHTVLDSSGKVTYHREGGK